jgi:hypothetical protein
MARSIRCATAEAAEAAEPEAAEPEKRRFRSRRRISVNARQFNVVM